MSTKRPNFLIILADDLGYSDIGCYGGEIRTPNIDDLARHGVRFSDFYATALCSPSRSMILTGTDNHIAGLGSLIEWLTNPTGSNSKGVKESQAPARGKPGYEGYLNERVVTLPEVLRDAGYLTLCAGKWHLGLRKDKSPWSRGFQRSFAMMAGSSNHYGWEPQLESNEEAPRPFSLNRALHMQDGEYVFDLPTNWYSSKSFSEIMLGYLKDWQRNRSRQNVSKEEAERPFFAYLPFTAPHWPLQAPQEYVQHYRDAYKDGPDELRLRRLRSLIELGLVDKDVVPHPVIANEVPEWSDLSPEHKEKSARAMEVYAGMVECMDDNVGKIISYLKHIDEFDNTFVLFLSDNGAEGGAFEAQPAFHGGPMAHLQKYYDNSLENLGNYDSFLWYGPRWAQASTAPSKLYKGYPTEGGIRVPFVAKFPSTYQCPVPANGITSIYSNVMDIAPTFLEMAGATHPAPFYQGREVVPMRGRSMVPWLRGEASTVHRSDFVEGWEVGGRAAVRKGHWKAVYLPSGKGGPSARGRDRWELFDLSKDHGEVKDLAEQHPELLRELIGLWDQYVIETGIVPLNPELGEFIAATEGQMPDDGWMDYEYWKPGAREDPEKYFVTPKRFDKTGGRVEYRDGALQRID